MMDKQTEVDVDTELEGYLGELADMLRRLDRVTELLMRQVERRARERVAGRQGAMTD
jgi:hypothetical protein